MSRGTLTGSKNGKKMQHHLGKLGGYLKGPSHKEGGIKAVVKPTGQIIEMEGEEVVITKPAVQDNTLKNFEGEMLTNRQILSKINESGGGVSFAKGGDIPTEIFVTGKKYKIDNQEINDSTFVESCGCKHVMAKGGPLNTSLNFTHYNKPIPATDGKHKMSVLVKKGDTIRLLHFGDATMEDYTMHKDDGRKANYLSRSAGIKDGDGNLTKNNPLSANYWSRRILWDSGEPILQPIKIMQDGGEINNEIEDVIVIEKIPEKYRINKNEVLQQLKDLQEKSQIAFESNKKIKTGREFGVRTEDRAKFSLPENLHLSEKPNYRIIKSTEFQQNSYNEYNISDSCNYRDVYKKITFDNYYIGTKAVFKKLPFSGYEELKIEWENLKTKYNNVTQSPKSSSEYITTEKGVYRFSDHWGRVASCDWDLINEETQDFADGLAIGYCDLADFSLRYDTYSGYRTVCPDYFKLTVENNIREIKNYILYLENIRTKKSLREKWLYKINVLINSTETTIKNYEVYSESFKIENYAKGGTIKDKVIANSDLLKNMKTHSELRQWAIENEMDNRSAFPKFKLALNEIGLDYDNIKQGIFNASQQKLEHSINYQLVLYVDAKASAGKFGITDEDGNVLWYGRFFEDDDASEQSKAELAAAKKAVWFASKVKEAIDQDAIALKLFVDAQWLTYQTHGGQKGYVLTQMARRYNIDLDVVWIPGKENPADEWTTANGYKKWNDNDLKSLATLIEKQTSDDDTPDVSFESQSQVLKSSPEDYETSVIINNKKINLDFNQQKILFPLSQNTEGFKTVTKTEYALVKPLEAKGIIYATQTSPIEIRLTDEGAKILSAYNFNVNARVISTPNLSADMPAGEFFKGIDYPYKNPYLLNKAIEELFDSKKEFTAAEKIFLSYYSGYGGLEKFGASGTKTGLLNEFYTPDSIVQKMWALAYKYGYNNGPMLDPSSGVGAFIKYARHQHLVTAYEINPYSAGICKILYPNIKMVQQPFETTFIVNRNTIKDRLMGLQKYDLVMTNPPYGKVGGIYMGMGEEKYTEANNYVDYFITRGLDLLNPGGLLVYIIGTEVAFGGTPFLQKGNSKVKQDIAAKSLLLDAYRLPNGVFDRTDVLSDIIVLQKK